MGKRKVTNADDMLPVQQVVALETVRPDLGSLVDQIIVKVESVGSVGHMHYVRKYRDEALVLLAQLRDSV